MAEGIMKISQTHQAIMQSIHQPGNQSTIQLNRDQTGDQTETDIVLHGSALHTNNGPGMC